mgnify:CR=1 FL=1
MPGEPPQHAHRRQKHRHEQRGEQQAIVGRPPGVADLGRGATPAIANKETLVMAGAVVMPAARAAVGFGPEAGPETTTPTDEGR